MRIQTVNKNLTNVLILTNFIENYKTQKQTFLWLGFGNSTPVHPTTRMEDYQMVVGFKQEPEVPYIVNHFMR